MPDSTSQTRRRTLSQNSGYSADSEDATNDIESSKTCKDDDNAHPRANEDEDGDPFWPSPILQRAMIESPREQGMVDWVFRYRIADDDLVSSSIDSALGRPLEAIDLVQSHIGSSGSQKFEEANLASDRKTFFGNVNNSTLFTPGGSRKSVTFGRARVVSDSDEHSDYFSMGRLPVMCTTLLTDKSI